MLHYHFSDLRTPTAKISQGLDSLSVAGGKSSSKKRRSTGKNAPLSSGFKKNSYGKTKFTVITDGHITKEMILDAKKNMRKTGKTVWEVSPMPKNKTVRMKNTSKSVKFNVVTIGQISEEQIVQAKKRMRVVPKPDKKMALSNK